MKFSKIKNEILKELNKRASIINSRIEDEGFSLIDGFTLLTCSQEISTDFVIGGDYIKCMSIVGNKTGLLYFFPLKHLLPKIKK